MIYYTTTEQSKKLVELGLNPDTADMSIVKDNTYCNGLAAFNGVTLCQNYHEIKDKTNYIPCWSLGALLEVMPDGVQTNSNRTGVSVDITFVHNGVVTDNHRVKNNTYIEAAYNMVVWLLENGYIQKGEKIMKANEAPEKIYIQSFDVSEEDAKFDKSKLFFDDVWTEEPEPGEENIEYTRTDTFIEKAAEWLRKNADDYTWYDEMEGESGMIDGFIEVFRNYMKGE